MFKRILAAVAASVAISVPALARIETGTPNLIRTAERYGATFSYNPSRCNNSGFNGLYRLNDRHIILCYRGRADANDHDTVRHEVFHFVQHCAARRRNVKGLTPLSINSQLRNRWIRQTLDDDRIVKIKSAYPRTHWIVELEAFAAAQHYTSAQLSSLITKWCKPIT